MKIIALLAPLILFSVVGEAQPTENTESLGFVAYNSKKITDTLYGGDQRSPEAKRDADRYLKPALIASGPVIVEPNVVYFSKKLDVTDQITTLLREKSANKKIDIYRPGRENSEIKIAAFDANSIFSQIARKAGGDEAKHKDEVGKINMAIREIARVNKITLVFQSPYVISSPNDITDAILSAYLSGAGYELKTPLVSSYYKIGYVQVGRITKESALGKKASGKLKEEFIDREREISNLEKQVREGAYSSDLFREKLKLFRDDFQLRQNEEYAKVIDAANKSIKAIALAEQIDLIVQDVSWVHPSLDVTSKVLAAMSKIE